MDEVDVHTVDLGHKLRQRVQPRLTRAPVVVRRPELSEGLDRRQLRALRAVVDELLARPTRRADAIAQVLERVVGDVDAERTDRRRVRLALGRDRHLSLLGWRGSESLTSNPSRRARGDPGLSPGSLDAPRLTR